MSLVSLYNFRCVLVAEWNILQTFLHLGLLFLTLYGPNKEENYIYASQEILPVISFEPIIKSLRQDLFMNLVWNK